MTITIDGLLNPLSSSSVIEDAEENIADSNGDSQNVPTPVVLDTSNVVAGCFHYSDEDDQNHKNTSLLSSAAALDIGVTLDETYSTVGNSSDDTSIRNEVHYNRKYLDGGKRTGRMYHSDGYDDNPRLDHANDTYKNKRQREKRMIKIVLLFCLFLTLLIVSVVYMVALVVAPRMKFNSVNDSNIDPSGTYENSEDTENNSAYNQGIIEDIPEPTTKPTELPTHNPSFHPSFNPSSFPSNIPSQYPSIHPSLHPTLFPTSFPTHKPTISIMPSHSPTKYPTQEPTIHPTSAPTGVFVNFFIMGDIPYDKKEARNLERTVQTMPNDASFIIHVGDINRAKKGCPLENYENVRRIFLQAPLPFFLIPGDNDWNDCSNTTEAWSFWTENFDQLHRNWSHDLPVIHQFGRTENFAFFLEDFVLFIGLNIVGGSRHDEVEWETRLDSQLKWTEQLIDSYMDRGLTTVVVFGHAMPRVVHRTFFRGFVRNAKNQYSDLQFLYTHGDGHMWEVQTKYEDADNILRVQVDDGNDVPFYQVRVEKYTSTPFRYTEFKE